MELLLKKFSNKKEILSLTQSDQTSVNLQFQDYFTKHIFYTIGSWQHFQTKVLLNVF